MIRGGARWRGLARCVVLLGSLWLGVVARAAVNCNVDSQGSPFPDLGDVAALLTQVSAGSASGACAAGGCDFDNNSAAAPTQTDLDALISVILENDPGGICSVGVTGTLERTPDTAQGRAASQTFTSPTTVQVSAVDVLTGQTLSLRAVSPDGFGEFRVPLEPTATPRDVMLVATDGARTLKTVVEAVSTQTKDAGGVDFGSTVLAEVYQYQKRDLGQSPTVATLRQQLKDGGYILDGASHTEAPGAAYLSQVKTCLSGDGVCSLSNAQPKLAFAVMENNYIATYFFAFAYQAFNQYGPTARTALLPGLGTTGRSASLTCATGETQVTANICFSFTTGLTMTDQPIDGTSCVANGTLKPQLRTDSEGKFYSQWQGPLTISNCATTDLLENGVVQVDIRYYTSTTSSGVAITKLRNSSLDYQSSVSSLHVTLTVPAADGNVCIIGCPDTYDYARDASMAGNYVMTFDNTQAHFTAQGNFSYPAASNVLISGTLLGTTRDGSVVQIPYSVDGDGKLTLTADGTISLAAGQGTITYSSAAGQFTFTPQSGGSVSFTGPSSTSGTIVYATDGSGSGNLSLQGASIGALSWAELTKRATLQFASGAALPSATVYVIAK